MFNKQFMTDFFHGAYCPSDCTGSDSFEMRYLSNKIDNTEKNIRKNLNKKSKYLISKLSDYHHEEIEHMTMKAYYEGINFAFTLFINALNSDEL